MYSARKTSLVDALTNSYGSFCVEGTTWAGTSVRVGAGMAPKTAGFKVGLRTRDSAEFNDRPTDLTPEGRVWLLIKAQKQVDVAVWKQDGSQECFCLFVDATMYS